MTILTNCGDTSSRWKSFSTAMSVVATLAFGSLICTTPVRAEQQADVVMVPKMQVLAQVKLNNSKPNNANQGQSNGAQGQGVGATTTVTGTLNPNNRNSNSPQSGSISVSAPNSGNTTPSDSYDPNTSPGRLQQNRKDNGVQKVMLLSGLSPATIATTPIADVIVNFTDANGTPWPATSASNSDPSNWQMSISSNSLRVQPLRNNLGQLSVTVLLQGIDIPLQLNVYCCQGTPGAVTTLQISNKTIPTR